LVFLKLNSFLNTINTDILNGGISMRWREIKESMGGTCSGSVATVNMPIGGVQRRNPDSFFSGVVANDSNPTPNTPDEYKKKKRKK